MIRFVDGLTDAEGAGIPTPGTIGGRFTWLEVPGLLDTVEDLLGSSGATAETLVIEVSCAFPLFLNRPPLKNPGFFFFVPALGNVIRVSIMESPISELSCMGSPG